MPRESLGPEKAIGLELFFTDSQGIAGALKRVPEDFVVDEVSRFPPQDDEGGFVIATVTSTNWETNRLVRQLGQAMHMSRNRINFAGTKDKRGVTSQLMSFEASLEAVQQIGVHDVSITNAYRSRKHITIGDLIGNSFRIWVRDCRVKEDELRRDVEETLQQLNLLGGFPNFFGVQRFGSLRPITHIVGKHIIRGDMEGACMAYVGEPVEQESPQAKEARGYVDRTKDFQGALPLFPQVLTFERMMVGYLARNPGDYAGAIGVLPPNLQMMFVHAYQSYLFNRMLCERVRRGLPLNQPLIGDLVLPVDKDGLPDHEKPVPVNRSNLDLVAQQVRNGRAYVGGLLFGSESLLAEGIPGEIERLVLSEEHVEGNDFIVPQLQKCSSRGSRRELVAKFDRFQCSVESDDACFSFVLGKGCYATSLLREFIKTDQIEADRAAFAVADQERADEAR